MLENINKCAQTKTKSVNGFFTVSPSRPKFARHHLTRPVTLNQISLGASPLCPPSWHGFDKFQQSGLICFIPHPVLSTY